MCHREEVFRLLELLGGLAGALVVIAAGLLLMAAVDVAAALSVTAR